MSMQGDGREATMTDIFNKVALHVRIYDHNCLPGNHFQIIISCLRQEENLHCAAGQGEMAGSHI